MSKHALYSAYRTAAALVWRWRGARDVAVLGVRAKFHPGTEFPLATFSYPLPAHAPKARIVKYGDFCQLHAVLDYVAGLPCPEAVVDVGAHHGTYAVLAGMALKQKFGTGRVIAVEPNPANFQVLRENVRLNALEDIVSCVEACCSNCAGLVHISDGGSQSQVTGDGAGPTVSAVTLESLLEEHRIKRPGLVMIDVEGAELPVLRGMNLRRCMPDVLLCELHPGEWPLFDYSCADFRQFLDENGLLCIDAYMRERRDFERQHYIGPAALVSRAYPSVR
jgi:FkbM family methyltransferase